MSQHDPTRTPRRALAGADPSNGCTWSKADQRITCSGIQYWDRSAKKPMPYTYTTKPLARPNPDFPNDHYYALDDAHKRGEKYFIDIGEDITVDDTVNGPEKRCTTTTGHDGVTKTGPAAGEDGPSTSEPGPIRFRVCNEEILPVPQKMQV